MIRFFARRRVAPRGTGDEPRRRATRWRANHWRGLASLSLRARRLSIGVSWPASIGSGPVPRAAVAVERVNNARHGERNGKMWRCIFSVAGDASDARSSFPARRMKKPDERAFPRPQSGPRRPTNIRPAPSNISRISGVFARPLKGGRLSSVFDSGDDFAQCALKFFFRDRGGTRPSRASRSIESARQAEDR